MDNVEAKLDAAVQKKGIFAKKQVTTVDDATAPMQQTLKNLREVVTVRATGAKLKAEQIAKLEGGKVADEAEVSKAERILEKLEELFA